MEDKVIDLRSDTVTKPSAAMRRAMAEAEVGDDVYLEDPTVNRLQARAADIFGREAGLFVPSGSMGNLVCIMAQAARGEEVICEGAGHIYNYEMAAMSALGGVLPRVLASPDGILHWQQIAPAIREKAYYRPQTALIALENSHNMAGGTVYPTALAREICDRAHAAGLKVHLDGARIFNAAVYLRETVATITEGFDSVQFCFSKGLGAPVGSMIVGSQDFIERCRVVRGKRGEGLALRHRDVLHGELLDDLVLDERVGPGQQTAGHQQHGGECQPSPRDELVECGAHGYFPCSGGDSLLFLASWTTLEILERTRQGPKERGPGT